MISTPGAYEIPPRPAMRVTASATPAAVALLTALLGLEARLDACMVKDDGTSVWHLRGGLTVTLAFGEDGDMERAHWHLDREPPAPKDNPVDA
jgi:hypothetical protein